jgi:hypothetical protein
MLLKRKPRKQCGIFFAVWPRRTIEGDLVMLEWLHWERVLIEGWGWGSGDEHHYRYRRWVPEDRAGERALRMARGVTEGWGPEGRAYATPPSTAFCKNYRTDGPTPCHYPHCRTRDPDGTERCSVDGIGFGEM